MLDRKLQGFVRVAEMHSFTAAAESLFISQSALSQQIKLLEQQLGFALFDRHARGAALTQAGAAFLPHARELLALYDNAVEECKTIAKLEQQKRARLKAGCLDNHIFTIWPELYRLVPPSERGIPPRPARYNSRVELYRALLRREEDMAVQLENEELYRFGLQFHPITFVPEVCQLFNPTPEIAARERLTEEDLLRCRVSFHFEKGHTIYEDGLRARLKELQPDIRILEPNDFTDAQMAYQRTTVLLVPGIQYPGSRSQARPLDWNTGLRIGFVTVTDCSATTLDYIRQVQQAIHRAPTLWQWEQLPNI